LEGNLGNWCTQYHIPIKYTNNTGKTVIVTGYIRRSATTKSNYIILRSGNNNTTYKGYLQADGLKPVNAWKWFEKELAGGESIEDFYHYILGTNSTAGTMSSQHIWTIEYK
jgi:hypothetical protein